ncbi:MAG TPA: response regulator [Chloroflexota bacterium]|nr:response regulator [Chloroflexota bacterium]
MNRQLFRVMIVDDDSTIRGLLAEALTEEGYTAVTAADGIEALDVLATTQPNLVLLDLQMPKMDGRAFVQALSNNRIHTPIIIMSAGFPTKSIASELGAQGHLAKPFDLDHVIDQVQRIYAEWSDTKLPVPTTTPTTISQSRFG